MTADQIRFDDGAAYERYMGVWSRLVGEAFLTWLAPAPRLRWLDVGCGNGAFTDLILRRCAPAAVDGIDPAEGQLAFARTRYGSTIARFRQGDAMALPLADDAVDVAVMPLVIFFVPQPSVGVAEMTRVVTAGGIISAYAWDMPGGGFPYDPLQAQMRAMGIPVPMPPSPEASSLAALQSLWVGAGLEQSETTVIEVERSFTDFTDYWTTIRGGPSVGPRIAALPPVDTVELQERMRALLPADATGRITCRARANAIRGRVPR